jgi:hypothetical protein
MGYPRSKLVQDGESFWGPGLLDMLMGLLAEALTTGREGDIGQRLRSLAVAAKNEEAARHVLAQAIEGQIHPWEAFVRGAVFVVVRRAMDRNPETCQQMLRRWELSQRYYAKKKRQ